MHITIDSGDKILACCCEVFLDGVRLDCCVAACEEAGKAICRVYTMDIVTRRRSLIVAKRFPQRVLSRLFTGQVEIRLSPDASPAIQRRYAHRRAQPHEC